MLKFIIVTGGVLSGLGKGIAAASIGHLLANKYKVIPIKCDGYLNVVYFYSVFISYSFNNIVFF